MYRLSALRSLASTQCIVVSRTRREGIWNKYINEIILSDLLRYSRLETSQNLGILYRIQKRAIAHKCHLALPCVHNARALNGWQTATHRSKVTCNHNKIIKWIDLKMYFPWNKTLMQDVDISTMIKEPPNYKCIINKLTFIFREFENKYWL